MYLCLKSRLAKLHFAATFENFPLFAISVYTIDLQNQSMKSDNNSISCFYDSLNVRFFFFNNSDNRSICRIKKIIIIDRVYRLTRKEWSLLDVV